MQTTGCSGGRRRRGRKSRASRGSRKMRGGNFYGPGGAIAPGAMQWDAVPNTANDPVTGAAKAEYAMPGGRRRAGKKATRKGKKSRRTTRRRTMRGGANWVSSSGVGASFSGDGVAGLGNYSAYAPKAPTGGPSQGADGVYSA